MKKIAIAVSVTLLVACGKSAEEQKVATMVSIQPCLAQGIDIDRCTQAYNGRAKGDSTNWLGMLAAAGAGAALTHALSKPSTTSYSPGFTQQNYQQPAQPVFKTPEISKSTLIPNQKVQPLFVPSTIAKSLTPGPASLSNATSVFKPSSPAKVSVFKPSSPAKRK